jgi:transcriptional regulator with XRE-family HTH domain
VSPRKPEPPITPALAFFGAVATHFRRRAGLTQQELAELLHYSGGMIGMVECGRRVPGESYLLMLDDVLDAGGLFKEALPMLEAEQVGRLGPLRVDNEIRANIAALAAWAFSHPEP